MPDAEPAEKAPSRNIGINPEELLVLPNTRGGALDGPRRRDLFSALRLRRDATSSREKRRRRQTCERRQSVEVLAGMLTRSGRDARLSKTDEQQTSDGGRHLTLLRAGCQRPAIQQLHEVGAVGLGQAVALAEGGASDLDSGISEWGSCDERESAAFEALLEEEARSRRKLWDPPSSETPSCSSDDSPPPRPRARRSVPSSVRSVKPAIVALPEARREVVSKLETKESATTVDKGASQMESTHPVAPPLFAAASEDSHECIPTVPSVREVERCSEGTQCSGPPVNVAVQTSALRLPRKSAAVRERVVHASPPAAPPERSTPATERLEKAAAAEVEVLRGGTFSGETPSEPTGGGNVGARTTTRVHVRVGLEGLEDADRGQKPTVWAVAGASSDVKASGPFVMLPLEGDEKRGAALCGVKTFLSVTDFTADADVSAVFTGGGIGSDDTGTALKSRRDNASAFFDPAHVESTRGRRSRRGHPDSEEEEAGCREEDGEKKVEEEQEEEEEQEQEQEEKEEDEEEWQQSRLDPLWTGVGSLGERLNGVGFLFDQLEGEMDHDRQVVENYQNEAQEEAEMVARDLEGIRAQRVSGRWGNGFVPQVPLLRRRPDESIQNAIDLGLARAGMTRSPSAEERPLVHGGGGDRSSFCCGSEGGDSYPGAEVATLKAEEELWEARAILEAIERALRAGNGTTLPSTPEAHLLTPAIAAAVTSTPGTAEKAGEPAMSRSSRPSSPHAFPRTETETPKKVSSAGSARSHPHPGRTLGGDPRLRRRRAALVQRSTGQSSARANVTSYNNSSNSGRLMHDSSIRNSNRNKGSGVPCRLVTGRAWSATREGDGTRSTGTAVAHFPTAVAATTRSKARDKATARRGRG